MLLQVNARLTTTFKAMENNNNKPLCTINAGLTVLSV